MKWPWAKRASADAGAGSEWGDLVRATLTAGDEAAAPSTQVRNLTWAEAYREGLFGPVGQPGAPAVTDTTATQVSTVFACLAKLGGVVAQLPVHHYRSTPNGQRQRITPHSPLWELLNESPSPAWTAASWREWIVRCVMLRGDQHTLIVRRGAAAAELVPLHPDRVSVKRDGGRLIYAVSLDDGSVIGVDQDDMLHFAGFGFDGKCSMSAIRWAARSAVAGAISGAAHMARTLAGNGMPKIALEYPGKMSTETKDLLREQFVATYGAAAQSGVPLVLTEGAKASELSISPVDLELLDARKFNRAEICEAMGVPPIIIGNSEGTSSWGTGVEQIMLGWVRFSVAPMLVRWQQELNRKLLRGNGQFVEFELDALLRGDAKSQAEYFRAGLGGPGSGDGWMSVNEVRRLKNETPIAGDEFDTPFRAQRSATASTTAAAQGTTP